MSCRNVLSQPAIPQAVSNRSASDEYLLLILHLIHMPCVQALQESCRFGQIVFRILRLNAQKELVGRRMGKAIHVEDRMIRFGQFVERDHAENGEGCCSQNRQLKRYRNECRPTVQWPATNIQWIADGHHPVLHSESRESTTNA